MISLGTRAALALGVVVFSINDLRAQNPWVVYEGKGPGQGKHIVLVAADDEYRSEELIPQLAKILAKRHGFKCTVLFSIDKKDGTINPGQRDNIPGLEALKTANLFVLFARFRELPDAQMKYIVDYINSGKPIIGLRTSTHAFNYSNNKSPYAKYTWTSRDFEGGFGRQVLGETWVNHWGHHGVESTRGLPAKGMEKHPILKGVDDIWGPSDVYEIRKLTGDSRPVVMGQVLKGMSPKDEPNPKKALMPLAWIKTYTGTSGKPARVFATTLGHGGDFKNEGVRRLLVNACYWCLAMEDGSAKHVSQKTTAPAPEIYEVSSRRCLLGRRRVYSVRPATPSVAAEPLPTQPLSERRDVRIVGSYNPPPIGVGGHRKGIKPSDLSMDH